MLHTHQLKTRTNKQLPLFKAEEEADQKSAKQRLQSNPVNQMSQMNTQTQLNQLQLNQIQLPVFN